jgi:hypothetical protein
MEAAMTPFQAVVAADLIRQGYKVLTSGWPDFCAVREENGKTTIRFIEVKGKGDDLRTGQTRMHGALRAAGFDVEVIRENRNQPMTWSEPNPSQPVQPNRDGRPDDKLQASVRFLRNRLQDGPRTIKSLIRDAREVENLSRSTMYHAAKFLQVLTKTYEGRSIWELPRPSQENSPAVSAEE